MRSAVIVAVLIVAAVSATAATLYVPDDYTTIQSAIDAAGGGTTILVRPGTYLENLDFKGKAITVRSELGPDVTSIDGGSPASPDEGSVVAFSSDRRFPPDLRLTLPRYR